MHLLLEVIGHQRSAFSESHQALVRILVLHAGGAEAES
jgi:hypothetical protein